MEPFVFIGAVGFVALLVFTIVDFDFDADFDMLPDADWLNLKVVAAAAVGFGAFGVIASSMGTPVALTWIMAAIGFFGTGIGSYQLVVKPLKRLESNSVVGRQSYLNQTAIVTLAIEPGRQGLVRFTDSNGALVEESATATEPYTIPRDQHVVIYEVHPHHVAVVPINV